MYSETPVTSRCCRCCVVVVVAAELTWLSVMLTPRFSYLLLCLRDKDVELLPEASDEAPAPAPAPPTPPPAPTPAAPPVPDDAGS